ncbi:Dabb family protein [Chlorobium sp. N1]|uniref:Dabb family protein n=1 Tax=Chlorobium sp. N1 TaxID=2491138 RepID=UPI001039B133|nr:Dabb family protein [Chlorobium sp. N1]TCD47146.1 Dabb family protein [Chlorobium sp. N1]
MVRHVVMWRLKEDACGMGRRACAEKLVRELEGLRDLVPGILSLEAGVDRNCPGDAHDVVLVSDFPDWAALDAYQRHPEHERVRRLIAGAAASRAVVDYEIG